MPKVEVLISQAEAGAPTSSEDEIEEDHEKHSDFIHFEESILEALRQMVQSGTKTTGTMHKVSQILGPARRDRSAIKQKVPSFDEQDKEEEDMCLDAEDFGTAQVFNLEGDEKGCYSESDHGHDEESTQIVDDPSRKENMLEEKGHGQGEGDQPKTRRKTGSTVKTQSTVNSVVLWLKQTPRHIPQTPRHIPRTPRGWLQKDRKIHKF